MEGLRQIPLNFIMNKNPPIKVPAPYPPGRERGEEIADWYDRTMDLRDKYEHRTAKIHPVVCMENKSSITIESPGLYALLRSIAASTAA